MISLNSLTPHLIYSFRSEHELVQSIEELSHNFTKNRDSISDYLKDKRLVAAYTLFYLSTNIGKWNELIKRCDQGLIDRMKKMDFIDVGAGPGTFSLAFRLWGGTGDVYQIEKSDLMREQAQHLWNGLKMEGNLHQRYVHTQKEKILFFGHSANEMKRDEVCRLIDEINPEVVIFIEPGTKDFFSEILSIRTHLIAQHFNLEFPCPTLEACPMRKSSEDWCHQFIHLKHSPEIERLCQLVKKDRKLLPIIFHVYTRQKTIQENTIIVRVLPETKFSFEWQVCLGDEIKHWQIMKKDYSKDQQKILAQALSGDRYKAQVIKAFDQTLRVKIIF